MEQVAQMEMSKHVVRPDVRAFLDGLAAVARPPFSDAMVAMMRQMKPEDFPPMDLPIGELGTIRDVTMPRPGTGPGGGIALRLFDPRESREPGPVVVFYHGGGFVLGGIDTHAALAASIARGLDLPVVSVEYRLAPEHRWPAQPDDAEAAARWIAENAAAFDRSFTGLVLCGDSAGGTLTIVTALALRDKPATLPLLMQWPIYPASDLFSEYPSGRQFSSGYALDLPDMTYFTAAYAADPGHWRGAPTLLDQAGLPPTFVVTAGLDPLRDQGRAYAAKLIAAGVNVTYREYPGTIHGFCCYRLGIPSAAVDVDTMIAIARAMIAEAVA
ncbi:MAG: alpha/beta hydrolase [Novosphingobium sp.]